MKAKGVAQYMTDLEVANAYNGHDSYVVSPMLKWYLHETALGVWSSTIENKLKAAIDYCHDHPVDLSALPGGSVMDRAFLLRSMGGIDAPIGALGRASWLLSRGVSRFRSMDNESSLYGREIFQPNLVNATSRGNYLDEMSVWITRLATILNGNDKGGHPRWHHVHLVDVAGPENGAEMSYGRGAFATTFAGSAVLAGGGVGADTLTWTLSASPPSSYPTGSWLLKCGSEEVHQLSRVGATIHLGKRGHSGTAKAAHAAGAIVQYAGGKVVETTYDGYGPAWFDHQSVNAAAHASIGTDAQIRAGLVAYWTEAAQMYADILPAEVGVGVSGGQLLGDGMVGANDLLDVLGLLGPRFWAGTTNLREDYATTDEHAWLLRAIGMGCHAFTQTEAISKLLEPPAPGAMNTFIRAIEDAFVAGYVDILETGRPRFSNTTQQSTAAYRGWPGGMASEPQYLIG